MELVTRSVVGVTLAGPTFFELGSFELGLVLFGYAHMHFFAGPACWLESHAIFSTPSAISPCKYLSRYFINNITTLQHDYIWLKCLYKIFIHYKYKIIKLLVILLPFSFLKCCPHHIHGWINSTILATQKKKKILQFLFSSYEDKSYTIFIYILKSITGMRLSLLPMN